MRQSADPVQNRRQAELGFNHPPRIEGRVSMRIRKRLFVDHKVQGALMLRAAVYWFCCVLAVGLALLGRILIAGSSESFYDYFLDACHYFLTAGVV
jgi:hypothetical protein